MRSARRSIREASENSTSASVASASTRSDAASGVMSSQPSTSPPTISPAAVNANAGGSSRGRKLSSAMNASSTPEIAASDHVVEASGVIRASAPRRRG